MCRLFAQISPTPLSAESSLVRSEFSLLRQSNFNRHNLQKDGWGIAVFGNNAQPSVSKSPNPAYREAEAFTAAARAPSRVVIGHIRAASNPRGLPKERLINMESTQPYTDGRWVFAHNGTLEIPDEVAGRLGAFRRHVRSPNDSEVYFWQFVKFLDRTGDPGQALESCVRETWYLWEECRGRYPRKRGPYTSLNAVLSDGKSLHALCHTLRPGRAGHGVCNADQPWSVMSFARRGDRLLVASEDLDAGAWTRFAPAELLSADVRSGTLRVRRRRMEVPRQAAPAGAAR